MSRTKRDGFGQRNLPEAIRAIGEHLAFDERHHDVDHAVLGLAEPDDVADVRMREPHAESSPRDAVAPSRSRRRESAGERTLIA